MYHSYSRIFTGNNPYIDDASIPILLMFVKQNPLISNVNPGLINPVYDCLIGKVPLKSIILWLLEEYPPNFHKPWFSKIRGWHYPSFPVSQRFNHTSIYPYIHNLSHIFSMHPICKAISTHQYKQHQPKATRINETTPVTVLTGLLGSKAWPSRMLLGGSLKTSARVRQKL